MSNLELDDIQRLVLQGYPNRPSSRWALLTVTDPAKFGAWLQEVLSMVGVSDPVSRRADEQHSAPRLALAFTYPGLCALGLDEADLRNFDVAFKQGMDNESRARKLGDQGASAPETWRWGNAGRQPHLLLVLYSSDPAARDAHWAEHYPQGCTEPLALIDSDQPADRKEPFGYRDGVSQPLIAGSNTSMLLNRQPLPGQAVKPGEFVIGYENENGRVPVCPAVPAQRDAQNFLPVAMADPDWRDLGHNGSYLVVRQLAQNVDAFNAFLAQNAATPQAQEYLAAKLMGRWRSGAPLVLAPEADDERLAQSNDFTYHANDRYGYRCPLGAHIRRANPRDALVEPQRGEQSAEALARTARHRIIRRGRPYQGVDEDGKPERGILFAALNTNIENQFEFIQRNWINNSAFAGVHNETDPMAAAGASPVTKQDPDDSKARDYTMQTPGQSERVQGLAEFVTVKAGGYFFLPGMRALHFLALLTGEAPKPAQSAAPEPAMA